MDLNPSFYCDFTKSAQPLISQGIAIAYSGGANGTRFNENGLIVAASAPRLDYDPASVITNLAPRSGDFDLAGSGWNAIGGTLVIDTVRAPDEAEGKAYKLKADTNNSVHELAGPGIFTLGGVYTVSIYAKAAEETVLVIAHNGTGTQGFNLATGALGVNTGLSASAGIIPVGNGWYRCWLVTVPLLSAAASFDFMMRSGGLYVGDGTSGLYYAACQIEPGSRILPSRYIPNYGTSTKLSAPTPIGLLIEEARTNLLIRSDALDDAAWTKNNCSVSANATTSPDGGTTADKVIEDATAGVSHMIATPSWTSTLAAYTFSVFAKANTRTKLQLGISSTHLSGTGANGSFDLGAGTAVVGNDCTVAIKPYPNGWYRCSITFTPTAAAAAASFIYLRDAAGSSTYNGDGTSGLFLWGAQIELGGAASSYIPTTAATVGRSPDYPSTSVVNWLNQNESTWIGRFIRRYNNAANGRLVGYNRTPQTPLSLGPLNGSMFDGTAPTNTANVTSDNKPSTVASSYRKGDVASVCLDGGAVVSTANANFSNVTEVDFGVGNAGTELNGHLVTLAYYPVKIPDQALKTLTSATP